MFLFSLFLLYVNYLIPNKNLLFKNFAINLNKSLILTMDIFLYIYQIILVIFILVSMLFVFILLIGSIYRIFRIINKKIKQISYM